MQKPSRNLAQIENDLFSADQGARLRASWELLDWSRKDESVDRLPSVVADVHHGAVVILFPRRGAVGEQRCIGCALCALLVVVFIAAILM